MKTVGIIAEYNPLHKGHLHHISRTRQILKPDLLVVIVSSFFSQRGLPSLISRQDKTALALQAGADLVLELPAVYAAQSADYFALYAIESLKTAGVNTLCFGSELNDIELLKELEQKQLDRRFDPALSQAQNWRGVLGNLPANDLLGLHCPQSSVQIRHCHAGRLFCRRRTPVSAGLLLKGAELEFLLSAASKHAGHDFCCPAVRLFSGGGRH